LTDRHEADSPRPWSVDDAPASFIAGQLRAIVGVTTAPGPQITSARILGERTMPCEEAAAATTSALPPSAERPPTIRARALVHHPLHKSAPKPTTPVIGQHEDIGARCVHARAIVPNGLPAAGPA